MNPYDKWADEAPGTKSEERQPASPVRSNAQTTSTARRVNKSLAVVNGLLRLIPTAFFAWGAILCITHGVYWGALILLLAATYYGWRSLRYFMQ